MGNIWDEYAQLQAEANAIEEKMSQLRPHIIKMMIERGLDKMETSFGKFAISKRKVWKYPEAVTEIGEQFKEAKARAESTGEATYEEVDSLRFTQAKL